MKEEVPIVMERPTPTSTYVFAGIGTAAAISGAALGLSSWTAMDELEASCSPDCPKKTVDVARPRALISDISWGVSAAAFITRRHTLSPEAGSPSAGPDVRRRAARGRGGRRHQPVATLNVFALIGRAL